MQILQRAPLEAETEASLSMDETTRWNGFLLQGIPAKHETAKPQSQSAAVTTWRRVIKVSDQITVKEISARITEKQRRKYVS